MIFENYMAAKPSEKAHPYHGPLTDLGNGYYWAAERDGDTDDKWYNFFLLKGVDAANNLYKTISSFIKVRDYDLNLVGDDSDRIKNWLKQNNVIDLGDEQAKANAKDVKKYNRSSGLPPEDPEDPYYDTWQSIAQDHVDDEDAEDYVAGMKMPQFIERLLIIAGNSSISPQDKLRRILKMSFNAKRDLEGHEDEEHNDVDEKGELMKGMIKQGLIPKGSTGSSHYSGTREKR
jgi:hypothetical protein